MVQPNIHARNPISIDPQNYLFSLQNKKKKSVGLVTEIKKGRLGTSRTTAILKQEGNNDVISWQSADFPPNQQIAFFLLSVYYEYLEEKDDSLN